MPTNIRDGGGGGGGGGTFSSLQSGDPNWPDTVGEYGITDAELALGNPPADGYVLESLANGTRQWVLKPTDGVDGTSAPNVIVQYSQFQVVPGDFSTIYQVGDKYMIVSTDGGSTFSSPILIQGDQGDPGPTGNFVKYIFINATTQPSTPTVLDPTNGDTGSWFSTPPGGIGFTWFSVATLNSDATQLITTWSTPVRITQQEILVEYGPTSTGPWDSTFNAAEDIYMRQSTDGGDTWSASIKIVGETGADGPFTDIIFRRNNTQPATPTGDDPTSGQGWFDGPPAGDNALWISKGKKAADGTLIGVWSDPVKISTGSLLVQYSPDGLTSWDSTFTPGVDNYIRSSTNGGFTWSEAAQIVGETGQDGDFTSFIFASSNSGVPATPTGNDPTNGNTGPVWFDAPPTPIDSTYKTYLSKGLFVNGVLSGAWSTPIQLEGENGVPGEDALVLTMTASAQAFSYDSSSGSDVLVGPSSIDFQLNRQNISSGTTWTVTDDQGTTQLGVLQSVTATTATLPESNFNALANNSFIKVRAVAEGLSDEITIFRLVQGTGQDGQDGADAYTVILSNEVHTAASDSNGENYDLTGAGGQVTVFKGITNVTASCNFSIQAPATKNGLTISISNGAGTEGEYTLSGASPSWTTTLETFAIRVQEGSLDVDKVYTISKSVAGSQGAPGDPASLVRLSSTSNVFSYDNSSGTPVLSSDNQIDFTFVRQGIVGATTWQVFDSSNTLQGSTLTSTTNTSASLPVANFDTARGADNYIRVVATADSISDEITIVRLLSGIDGEGSYIGLLSNESHVVAANADGTGYSLVSANGTFDVFFGTTLENETTTYSVLAPATVDGLTMTISDTAGTKGDYSVAGANWTGDDAAFTLRAITAGSTTIDKVFTISKSLRGTDGNTSSVLRLTSTSQIFGFDNSSGTPVLATASTITFSVDRQNITDNVVWTLTDDQGANQNARLTGTSNSGATLTEANFSAITNNDFVTITATAGSFSDQITVTKLLSGADGNAGTAVIAGYLTNESHTVGSDSDGTNYDLTDAIGTFELYEGLTRRNTSASFAVVAPATKNGLTISVLNTSGFEGDYSVAGANWTSDQESFTLRASYSGVDVDKVFTISKSKTGDQGDPGNPGPPGTDGNVQVFRYAEGTSVVVDDNTALVPLNSGVPWLTNAPSSPTEPVWFIVSEQNATKTALVSNWSSPVQLNVDYSDTRISNNDITVQQLQTAAGWVVLPESGATEGATWGTNLINQPSDGAILNVNQLWQDITGTGIPADNATVGATWGSNIGGQPTDAELLNSQQSWSDVSGAGRPADNADVTSENIAAGFINQQNYEQLSFVVTNNVGVDEVTVVGNVIERTLGGSWDAQAYSREYIIGPFSLSFRVLKTDEDLMVGVTSDPTSNASFNSIDYAWRARSDAGTQVYENGTNRGTQSAYTTDTIFTIISDGREVQYYLDGNLEYTSPVAPGETTPYYIDSSMNTVGSIFRITNFSAGPSRLVDSGIQDGADRAVAGLTGAGVISQTVPQSLGGTGLTSNATLLNSAITLSSAGVLSGAGGGTINLANITGSVTASQVPDGLISTLKLADDAVTNAKIGIDAITAVEIADNAVTTAAIAAAAVTAAEIGAAAVTTAKIANDAITTELIAAGAITTTEIGTDAITTAKIAANAITATEIAAGAVTASEIAANSITAGEIAAGAITAAEIATGTITAAEIATNTITASEIAANAITASELAADSVSANNIVAGSITSSELAADSVTATQIAAGAVTASEIAAGTITAAEIEAGAITATEIAADTITSANLAANTIVAGDIAAGTITSVVLAANSVIADKIAANAIVSNKIAAGAIVADKIAAGAIDATKIAANTITAAEIAAGTITASELAANSVTASQIAANAVTASEIAAGTITATEIATNAIQATSLSAFAANLGTVTGGTFQTATSGKRCVISDTADNIFTIYNASDIPTFYINEAGDLTFSGRLSPNTLTSTEAFSQALLEQLNPAFKASSSTGGSFSLSNQALTTAITTNQTFDITGTILSGNGNDPVVTLTVTDAGQKAWNASVTVPSYTLTIQKRTSQTPGSTSYGSWGNIGTATRTGYANAGSQFVEDGFTFEIPARFGINTTLTVNDTVIDGFNVQYRVIVKYNSGDQNAPLISDATADEVYISGLWNTTISTTDPVDGVDIPDDIGHVWYVY